MAAVEPMRVALGPSVETQPFDINILCAKLEVAKREREEYEAAAALRKQVSRAVRRYDGQSGSTTASKRKSKTVPSIDTNVRGAARTHSSNHAVTPLPTRPALQQHNLSYVNVLAQTSGTRKIDTNGISVDRDEASHILISRSESGSSQQTPIKSSTTLRRPFSLLKNLTDDADSRIRRRLSSNRLDDVSKRHSVISPNPLNRLSSEPIPEHHPWTDSVPHTATRRKAAEQHTMGLINEYTVCFDTHETSHRPYEILESPLPMQPLPPDRPNWASRGDSNEGMRSLLNLPSMLKKERKDKVRMSVEELPALSSPPQSPPPKRTAAPRSRPHTRSNTAPETLINEAVEKIKAEERIKKRRSLGGLLQTILVPDHSCDSPHAHCVAI